MSEGRLMELSGDEIHIGLWTGARVPTEQGGHVHTCPECYEHVPFCDDCQRRRA